MGNIKGSILGGESKMFGYEHISGVPDKSSFDYGKEELFLLKLFPLRALRMS